MQNLILRRHIYYVKYFHSFGGTVVDEIARVMAQVEHAEVERFIDELLSADKVFIIGVGRGFLALQAMGRRLAHLGIPIQGVGFVTEKAITDKDVLLVASGSGESVVPMTIANVAKNYNARIGLITSSQQSTIKSMANFVVHLPCPTKTNGTSGVQSIQPMSTLFDQSLHIFGDIVALMIQHRKEMNKDELWKYHANLE